MNKSITSRWKLPQNNCSISAPASTAPSTVASPSVSEPGTPLLDGTETPKILTDLVPQQHHQQQPQQQPTYSLDPLAVDATPTALAHVAAEVAMSGGNNKPISKKRPKSSSNTHSESPGNKRYRASAGNSEGTNRGGAEHAPPKVRLEDLGGVDHFIEKVKEYVMMPLAHPEVYAHMGVKPPRGILLHGPPGTGKTMMANAIAGSLGVPFITISAPSVVSGMSGESEKKIREVFEEAKELAPCLMFIDEIDAITPKRETAQREMERRIVAQLLTCMDDLNLENTNGKPVMIIGATNRPDSLDPALRRAGRFDLEINIGVPDQDAREQILRVMSSKLKLAGDFDFKELAKLTPGYVGADLNALTSAAGVVALKRIFQEIGNVDKIAEVEVLENVTDELEMMDMDQQTSTEVVSSTTNEMQVDGFKREAAPQASDSNTFTTITTTKATIQKQPYNSHHKPVHSISAFLQSHPEPLTPEQLEPLVITNEDFLVALTKVQPSAKREGFATVPDVSWDKIGALQYVRDELRMAVVEPIKYPALFASVGIQTPAGVLLWGPPGCGKTLLAKAVASESRTNFISVKGPELLNKYVGESERGVRQVFARARASAPCVIFFDELDALCSKRDDSQSEASARVVNTLLTELDGMENRSAVYVIAATNRPDIIDPAMLRPGRLDKLLYVQLPTMEERLDILQTLARKTPLASDVQLQMVASDERCENFSGADLASLVREAGMSALRTTLKKLNAMGKAGEKLDDQRRQQTTVGDSTNTSMMGKDALIGEDNTVAELLSTQIMVSRADFDTAFTKVSPSVSPQDKMKYDKLHVKFGGGSAKIKLKQKQIDAKESSTEGLGLFT
ncbi:P-loop containing nucleoside triphosphate hydrolase protein [Lobosporangium transversale]|uniref:Peroxisomal ATPase PEX1 n=1 Tax=Lobosporangium transversale TaxID=64571 RepID=A0A1Y2GYU8_9FUNG|nr:P-loop containing nucleoside triphosphate hydrolase protein [Lobosporangium transversale]ORZ27446.1 P-loop containing nucleoside triphosphate hydrolase protein [Lobosporangium transversale]|eukprot:XP_021885173.1 P-loop containing nucleoside triphosphate hydrolase protein [Lobosporangium transversale]